MEYRLMSFSGSIFESSYEVMLYLHNHGVTDVVNALGGMQALVKRGDNM